MALDALNSISLCVGNTNYMPHLMNIGPNANMSKFVSIIQHISKPPTIFASQINCFLNEAFENTNICLWQSKTTNDVAPSI